MAKLKRKELKAHIKKHKSWQNYANKQIKAGKKPIPFKDYEEAPVYYGKISQPTYESRLRAAGIDWKKDKPSARLKRSKK